MQVTRRARWLLVGIALAACAGSSSAGRQRTVVAVGELQTGFTAGTTGFDFVFFPDEGQPVTGMHLVERGSAPELYERTDAQPEQRLRVELTGVIERASVRMSGEPATTLPRIRISSYALPR